MDNTIEAIASADEATVRQFLATYQAEIEVSEQKSAEAFEQMFRDDRYSFLVATSEGKVSGFATAFFPVGSEFWLLEYLAVSSGKRSRGLGGKLFQAAVKFAEARTPARHCVIEVEQPRDDASASRIRFYARQGCRRLRDLNYAMPKVAKGTPPPMHLLVHGLREQSVAANTVRGWISTIYSQVYDRNASDPVIDAMLAPNGASVAIEAL
jgi:GNAT superfamily N-acetyltransferase